MAVVSIDYIDVDEKNVARIAGKRTKVIQIIMDKMANGWGPEEIHNQYPHLSLAEIYAAFSYYYANQAELDAQITQDLKEVEAMRAQAGPSPIVDKLRRMVFRASRSFVHPGKTAICRITFLKSHHLTALLTVCYTIQSVTYQTVSYT